MSRAEPHLLREHLLASAARQLLREVQHQCDGKAVVLARKSHERLARLARWRRYVPIDTPSACASAE